MQELLPFENIYQLQFIVDFFFFIQSRESIYEPPRLKLTL